jgi:hypothetical protein
MQTCMSHSTLPSGTHTNPIHRITNNVQPLRKTHDCDRSTAHPRTMTHDDRRPMAGSAVTKGKTLWCGDWQPPRQSVRKTITATHCCNTINHPYALWILLHYDTLTANNEDTIQTIFSRPYQILPYYTILNNNTDDTIQTISSMPNTDIIWYPNVNTDNKTKAILTMPHEYCHTMIPQQ